MGNYKTKDDNKYIDITKRSYCNIQVFIGARGTGKTFSILRSELDNEARNRKFLYLRNSEREARIATSDIGNAFKAVNTKFNRNIKGYFNEQNGLGRFYDMDTVVLDEKGKYNPQDTIPIAYAMGLSTVAGARSIDLSDIDEIVFEEFIPERHVKKMRYRGEAFANFLETVIRNRESEGKSFPRVYLLANAISLEDEILTALEINDQISGMVMNGESRRTIPEKSVYIELIGNVDILKEKRNSALYKALADSYADDALTADFHSERLDLIMKTFNRKQYDLKLSFGDVAIYQERQNHKWHIAMNGERSKSHLLMTEDAALRRAFRNLYIVALGKNQVTFDNYTTRKVIEKALLIK